MIMNKSLFKKKKDCTGCEACSNVCPVGIIKMVVDSEGFYYPSITNADKCLSCGKCEKVCPVKNLKTEYFHETAFAGYSANEDDVLNSSSGGFATSIAKTMIKEGAVVYGVEYSDDFIGVFFSRAENDSTVKKFRTSKYAQSRKGNLYKNIQKDLMDGKKVLAFLLPCESYALKLFLKKEYDNLFVCTMVCHGTTSPSVHEQYITKIQNDPTDPITFFSVRHKAEGWKPYYIRAVYKSGKEHIEKFNESAYGVAFIFMKRPSCNVCPFKRGKLIADITMADYHNITKDNPLYNKNGVSSMIVHTEKGMELISKMSNFVLEEVPVKSAAKNAAYIRATPAHFNRKQFGKVFSEQGLDASASLMSCKVVDFSVKIKKSLLQILVNIKHIINSNFPHRNTRKSR